MKKYIFVYHLTDQNNMGSQEEWGKWFQENKASILDPLPFSKSDIVKTSKKEYIPVKGMGKIQAKDMEDAKNIAKNSPIIINKLGDIMIYEIMEM